MAQNVSVEIRPGDDVEIVAVLNDYPATPVQGGLQLALGDAWGGEARRIVLRLGIPAVADLGPRKVAELCLRWVDVTGAPIMHELTIPVLVNIGPGDEAAAAEVDGGVVEEVIVIEAAKAEREARRLADEGDYGAGRAMLGDAADGLRRVAMSSSRPEELLAQAEAMDTSGAAMSDDAWSAATSKTMHYRSRGTSRRRR